jgi:quinol monooxygenase YgiN
VAYTIFGTLKYDSHEDRHKVLPSFMAHRERCLANEPGTIQFDISLPNDDDTTIMLYEVYDDEDAFQAHAKGESMQKIRAELEALGVKASMRTVVRCTLAK